MDLKVNPQYYILPQDNFQLKGTTAEEKMRGFLNCIRFINLVLIQHEINIYKDTSFPYCVKIAETFKSPSANEIPLCKKYLKALEEILFGKDKDKTINGVIHEIIKDESLLKILGILNALSKEVKNLITKGNRYRV